MHFVKDTLLNFERIYWVGRFDRISENFAKSFQAWWQTIFSILWGCLKYFPHGVHWLIIFCNYSNFRCGCLVNQSEYRNVWHTFIDWCVVNETDRLRRQIQLQVWDGIRHVIHRNLNLLFISFLLIYSLLELYWKYSSNLNFFFPEEHLRRQIESF